MQVSRSGTGFSLCLKPSLFWLHWANSGSFFCDDQRQHFSPDLCHMFKLPANKIQRCILNKLFTTELARSWNRFQTKLWIWNLMMINVKIYYLLLRWICWLDTKIKAHNFPCSTLIQNYIFRSNISMDHFHTAMQKWQAFRNLLIKIIISGQVFPQISCKTFTKILFLWSWFNW